MSTRPRSRYSREMDTAAAAQARRGTGITVARCPECGSWWTVDLMGRPLSPLGEMAAAFHATHAAPVTL